MSEVWFEVSQYDRTGIRAREVFKETSHCVWVKSKWSDITSPERHFKAGKFFKSFEEAKNYSMLSFDREIKDKQAAIDRLKAAKQNVNNMAEPKLEQR